MKTIADIKRIAASAGGTVEEDHGHRDMRKIQVCSQPGRLWSGNDCIHIPIDWAKGNSPSAIRHNEETFRSLTETLSHGQRDMTEQEAVICSTE